MRKRFLWLLALAAVAAAQPANGPSGKRYALLVGNSEYHALAALPSVPGEMAAMRSALESADFQVTALANATRTQFGTAIEQLRVQAGDAFFFYFSGYTVEKEGENYLLPVDVDPRSPGALPALGALQDRVEKRTRGLKIFMLEAPHALEAQIPGYTATDLLQPDRTASHESVFAFASTTGPVAKRPGIGWFTQAVSEQIVQPGSRVQSVFQNAKGKVIQDAGQQPFVDDNLTPEYQGFYFKNPPPPPPPPPRPSGETRHNGKDSEEYVWIRPGKFQMGCVPQDNQCEAGEKPRHEVVISKGFWIGRNEVQVISYRQLRVKMPGRPIEDPKWNKLEYPMFHVSWSEARDYCAAAGGRLPTEAEWEYAARAGTENQVYDFDVEHNQANYSGTPMQQKIADRRTPVRRFSPNAWQLYDMAGNVWEWVNDFYGDKYYSETGPPVTDPQGPKAGKGHVVRGGGWDAPEIKMRTSYRIGFSDSSNQVGFRCVLEDTPATKKLLGLDSR